MFEFIVYVVQLGLVVALLGLALFIYLDGIGYLVLHVMALAGVGAYSFAIMTIRCELSIFTSLLISLGLASACGLLTSEMVRRLRGDVLTLATFGLAVAAYEFFRHSELTGGVFGIHSIPDIWAGEGGMALFLASVVLLLCVQFVRLWRLSLGGKILKALQLDELAALSVGSRIRVHQRWSGLLAGLIAGLAGICMAGTTQFIEPRDFRVGNLLVPLAAGTIGAGRGSLTVVGCALTFVAIFQGVRFVGANPKLAGPLSEISVCLFLALIIIVSHASKDASEYE